VAESSTGVIEQLFERMTAGDWTGYGSLLSPDTERIGPWGDRTIGGNRCVEMLAGPLEDGGTTWDVHRIVYAADEQSGFARVTALSRQDWEHPSSDSRRPWHSRWTTRV
jgi:hypothetical protein